MTTEMPTMLLGAGQDTPVPTQPDRHLLICCTPRSASATLSALLKVGGGLCDSAEYFSFPAEQRYNRRPDVAGARVRRRVVSPAYFHNILRLRTRHGVFSARVHESHLKRVVRAGLGRDLLHKALLVYLRRRNLQDQAISLTIAQETEDWGQGEHHSRAVEPDMGKLTAAYVRNLHWLIHQNTKWQGIFSMIGKPVLEISTEDLAANPVDTALAVMEHARVEADLDALRSEAGKRQRYASHAELKQRLKQQIAANLDPLELLEEHYRLAGKWRSTLASLLD